MEADLKSSGKPAAGGNASNAYALKVEGDALYPAVRHGSFLVLEPGGEPVQGELVLLSMKDGTRMLREWHSQAGGSITVLSVTGAARETHASDDVEAIHPVAEIISGSRWMPPRAHEFVVPQKTRRGRARTSQTDKSA